MRVGLRKSGVSRLRLRRVEKHEEGRLILDDQIGRPVPIRVCSLHNWRQTVRGVVVTDRHLGGIKRTIPVAQVDAIGYLICETTFGNYIHLAIAVNVGQGDNVGDEQLAGVKRCQRIENAIRITEENLNSSQAIANQVSFSIVIQIGRK